MSKDWRPIDHILVNLDLEEEKGLKPLWTTLDEFYWEINGKKVPMNDIECSKKYPLVSFLCPPIMNKYQDNKNDNHFNEKMAALEKEFEEVVELLKDRVNKYPDLVKKESKVMDFIFARNEYEFGYDSSYAQAQFCEDFFEDNLDLKLPEPELER